MDKHINGQLDMPRVQSCQKEKEKWSRGGFRKDGKRKIQKSKKGEKRGMGGKRKNVKEEERQNEEKRAEIWPDENRREGLIKRITIHPVWDMNVSGFNYSTQDGGPK